MSTATLDDHNEAASCYMASSMRDSGPLPIQDAFSSPSYLDRGDQTKESSSSKAFVKLTAFAASARSWSRYTSRQLIITTSADTLRTAFAFRGAEKNLAIESWLEDRGCVSTICRQDVFLPELENNPPTVRGPAEVSRLADAGGWEALPLM